MFSVASCKRLSGLECSCPYHGLRPFTDPQPRAPAPAAHLGLPRGALRAEEGGHRGGGAAVSSWGGDLGTLPPPLARLWPGAPA